jgi:hypothetical protein
VNAAAILLLAEKGLSAHDIAEVAMALEVRKDPTAAERQARHREKVKVERDDVTRDVTRDGVTDRVSLDKKEPQTPKKLNPSRVCETRARGWHRLPEGWRPTKAFPAPLQAKVDQWPPGTLDDEIAALKRWAANAEDKNGKGRKLDWDKALWNWLGRRHDERYSRQQRTNGMGRNQSNDGLSPTTRAARDVFGIGASH